MLVSSGQLNNGHNNNSLLHRAQKQQQPHLLNNNNIAATFNKDLISSNNLETKFQTLNGIIGANNNNSTNNNNIASSSLSSSSSSNTTTSSSSAPSSSSTSNFEPERPIGYGAFGVVWSVTDPRDHRRVALKKMPNVFQNLASCKRVFRELYMLSSFQHDNVLSLLDILQPTNPHFFSEIYILTELMQSDLHRIIVSAQPLSSDHVKVFVYQILRGLKYLHSANVLHRDIKPGNLLMMLLFSIIFVVLSSCLFLFFCIKSKSNYNVKNYSCLTYYAASGWNDSNKTVKTEAKTLEDQTFISNFSNLKKNLRIGSSFMLVIDSTKRGDVLQIICKTSSKLRNGLVSVVGNVDLTLYDCILTARFAASDFMLQNGLGDISNEHFAVILLPVSLRLCGSSCGVSILTAMLSSALKMKPVEHIAMTGELTPDLQLRSVTYLKQKVKAAINFGFTQIILPGSMIDEWEQLPDKYKYRIKPFFFDDYFRVFFTVFPYFRSRK